MSFRSHQQYSSLMSVPQKRESISFIFVSCTPATAGVTGILFPSFTEPSFAYFHHFGDITEMVIVGLPSTSLSQGLPPSSSITYYFIANRRYYSLFCSFICKYWTMRSSFSITSWEISLLLICCTN
jgi:hypothetical protein